MSAVGGTGITAAVGLPVTSLPSVRLVSRSGAGVPGLTVNFAVTAGGGTVTGATATTGSDGIATVGSWTLGPTAGANTLTATSPALPGASVVFTASATAGLPASIVFSRDSLLLDQWGDTATVTVTVRDAFNNLIPAPTLAWSSPDTLVARSTGGLFTSVRSGRVLARVIASGGSGASVEATIPVRVVAQRNLACIAPVATSRGAAAPMASYSAPEILGGLTSPTWDGSRALPFDFDGDGDDDVVRFEYSFPFSATYSGVTRFYKADGGVFRDSSAAYLPAGLIADHPRDFEIADFDGNGIDELLLVQHGYDASPYPGTPNIMLAQQGAALGSVATVRFPGMPTNGFSHGSAAADIDCDGDLDVVELILTPSVGNRLWINSGAGTFSNGTAQAPLIAGAAGQRWQETAFIDFDADGDPDLYLGARSGPGWNEDLLLVNDGFGNFRRSSQVTVPAPRFSAAHGVNNAKAADFDGDGRLDLILFEIPEPFSTSSAVRLWLNTGNGSFTDASVAWGLPSTCSAEIIEPLFVRDLNGDGWPDVMLPQGCPDAGGAGILTNTGTGFTHFAYGNFVSWLTNDEATPVDMNGDGKLSLFFGSRGGNPVLVRRP